MTELKIEKVTEDSPLKAKVQRIYIKSFPLFERVSLEPFFNSVSDGVEIFALSDEEDVVAFFCTLRKGKYYYLFYLAVDEDKRGKGIGSDILSAVIKNADGATVFLDCEGIYPGCKDRAARVKRLCFYHRNGFKEIGPLKTWRGEKFRTLVYGDKDSITPPRMGDYLARHLPNAEMHTIPQAAHAPFLSHPAQFSALLHPFFAS